MKIIGLHIESFGKLRDFSLSFEDGYNLFCEENGFGKTTLLTFIRVMLFGFEGEKSRSEEANERKRFEPWIRTGAYGGELVFCTNGKSYTLKKIFGKKEKEDVIELRDNKTGLPCNDFREVPGEGTKIGEQIFQIDSASFMRTVFVSQNDCTTESTDKIAAKIGKVAEDTADLSSFDGAIKQLHDLSNCLSFSRKTGEGSRLTEEIALLSQELSQREGLLTERNALAERVGTYSKESREFDRREEALEKEQNLINKANEAGALLGSYEELKTLEENEKKRLAKAEAGSSGRVPSLDALIELRNICFEYERSKARFSDNDVPSPEKTEGRVKDDLERIASIEASSHGKNTNKPIKWLMLAVGMLGIFLAIGGQVAIRTVIVRNDDTLMNILTMIAFALGLIFLIVSLFLKDSPDALSMESFALNAEVEQLSEKLDRYKSALADLQRAEAMLQKGFESIGEEAPNAPSERVSELIDKARTIADLNKRIEEVEVNCHKLEERINVPELRDIVNRAKGLRSAAELASEKEEIKAAKVRLLTLSQADIKKLNELEEKLVRLDEIESDFLVASERKEKCARKLESIEFASEYLNLAKEEFSAEYVRPMTESFKKWYGLISGNEPVKCLVDVNGKLSIEEAGLYRETKLFSAGFCDLFGLSLRMALIECMYKEEKPFIIMDDPFINLDDKRLVAAKRFIEEVADEYQVIFMTCHK